MNLKLAVEWIKDCGRLAAGVVTLAVAASLAAVGALLLGVWILNTMTALAGAWGGMLGIAIGTWIALKVFGLEE